MIDEHSIEYNDYGEDAIQVGNKVYIIRIWSMKNYIGYMYTVQNSVGQRVCVKTWIFNENCAHDTCYWNICLNVSKKSKRYDDTKITGHSGLENLLIAKEIIQYHIDNYLYDKRKYNNVICVWGADSRRYHAYKLGLSRYGFVEGRLTFKRGVRESACMYKIIEKEEKNSL